MKNLLLLGLLLIATSCASKVAMKNCKVTEDGLWFVCDKN